MGFGCIRACWGLPLTDPTVYVDHLYPQHPDGKARPHHFGSHVLPRTREQSNPQGIERLTLARQAPATIWIIEAGINPRALLCGFLLNCCEGHRKGLVSLLPLDNQYKFLVLSDKDGKDLCMVVWSHWLLLDTSLSLIWIISPSNFPVYLY